MASCLGGEIFRKIEDVWGRVSIQTSLYSSGIRSMGSLGLLLGRTAHGMSVLMLIWRFTFRVLLLSLLQHLVCFHDTDVVFFLLG